MNLTLDRNITYFITLVIILLPIELLYGQLKYEREYRIDLEKVPKKAHEFIQQMSFNNKIKWFKEEGLNKTSVEAKTKHNAQKYSLEFTDQGEIEDIEIEIKTDEISSETKSSILTHLESSYQKFKICKVQLQYIGEEKALQNILNKRPDKSTTDLTLRYEIVIRAKLDSDFQELELLFDENGTLLATSQIISKNSDNLEF